MEWNNNGDEASWPRAREEERGVERKREEKGGKAKIGAARWRNEGGVISRRNKREEEERERAGNLSSTPEREIFRGEVLNLRRVNRVGCTKFPQVVRIIYFASALSTSPRA